MSKFSKFAVTAFAAASIIVSTGAAFAAPVFSVAEPGNGLSISDFKSQLAVFNKDDVTALVNAKTVSVLHYDSAWTDGEDLNKAVGLLSDDAQSINQLREALKADPAAAKILQENKIEINTVVDIVDNGNGAVSLYVS
ncbi:hypothetical protein WH87_07740 [Devosia epidermidihirudinis]|uniref:Uncharacterized protein n=1 Tax=Devosia epidermidihirudinis TaxID=1293439 RepID=A0A0F5QDI1_9HYPH|nr:hypothetical protein [Devosia epidermidihirudinis]KKC38786.1 hypothetical protein WH87_07740 [Devosia epidermidihirudinis]